MLDAHSELAVPPESHFVPRLARRWGDAPLPEAKLGPLADGLLARPRFRRWGFSRAEVIDVLRAAAPSDAAAAIRVLFAAWAERAGKPRYADKTPRYVTRIADLAELFPEARFLHLVRDGRDVALSMADAFERGPQNAVQAALHWAQAVAAGRAQGEALGPDRYRELSYERLLEEPEAAVREICEFTRLPFEPAMLEPGRVADRVIAGYPRAEVHANLAEPFVRRRDWRGEMSAAEAGRFELVAGRELAAFGYPISPLEGDDEQLRLGAVAHEVERLRHELFRAERKSERRRGRLRRLERSRWARLGSSLGGLRARLRGGG